MKTKTLTKKSLSIVLILCLIVSCISFGMVTYSAATTITFTDNQGWGSNIYAYFWADGKVDLGGAWPGTKMGNPTANGYGQTNYSCTIPSGATYVIFTNGSDQTVDTTIGTSEGFYTNGTRDSAGHLYTFAFSSSGSSGGSSGGGTSGSYNLANNIQDGVILHCFNWKYSQIKDELPNIASAGFTAVQTSPAQPAGTGSWYWSYQPFGFYVASNALGTKDELKSLCTAADSYGIKVVVDVVANHLSNDHNRIQSDLRSSDFWHTFGSNINYYDRWQVTHGDIGMQDLTTENSYVQSVVKGYIQELKDIGVDGIRFDAAKHIGLPSEGDNFFSTTTSVSGLWYYGEILKGPDDRDSGNESLMKEYTNYISVTDSTYGRTLRESFAGGYAPSAYANWGARGISNNKLVYWAESHDTWSNGYEDGYSWGISQNNIDRAYAVAASRSGATALYFSRPSSSNKDSIIQGQKGSTHFTSDEVAAVNHFHNAMIGQSEYYVTSNNCSVVCREKGAVIVAGSGSNKYVSVTNGGSTTKPGTYKDEITGNTWTVTSTTISGTIGSSGIAVIY